jgi:hypothetical protein
VGFIFYPRLMVFLVSFMVYTFSRQIPQANKDIAAQTASIIQTEAPAQVEAKANAEVKPKINAKARAGNKVPSATFEKTKTLPMSTLIKATLLNLIRNQPFQLLPCRLHLFR